MYPGITGKYKELSKKTCRQDLMLSFFFWQKYVFLKKKIAAALSVKL